MVSNISFAGSQLEEPLSKSVKAMMQRNISDKAAPKLAFIIPEEGDAWLKEMSQLLKSRIPNNTNREDLLRTIHY